MVIIRFTGGLGNQLFQYAAARALAIDAKTDVWFDTGFYSSPENNELNRKFLLPYFKVNGYAATAVELNYLLATNISTIKKLKRRLKYGKLLYYREKAGNAPSRLQSFKPPIYLEGNFQDEEYFIRHSSVVQQELYPDFELANRQNQSISDEINRSTSVGVHIRRGDYVNNTKTSMLHGACDKSYYLRAMSELTQTVNEPVFFIFSDDPEWARIEFGGMNNTRIVVAEPESNKGTDILEFMLLTRCKHQVIANSSFSWWAAWLNTNPAKSIIGPERWFFDAKMNALYQNLIPTRWKRM